MLHLYGKMNRFRQRGSGRNHPNGGRYIMENMNEEEKNIIDRMQGKWYEQCANADVITIEKDHITYEYDGESTSGTFGVRQSEDDENEWNIGTGGGFPGIPLAVMFPEADFTLCDSIGKKTLVAREVASALGLQNVTVVNARAESLPGKYDYVVSRAVTTLDNFYPWVKDRFRGSIFYLKGGDVNAEIAQLMGRYRLKKGSVRTWRIDNWLKEEYFQEKFVIQIEKDYLCGPIVEKYKKTEI